MSDGVGTEKPVTEELVAEEPKESVGDTEVSGAVDWIVLCKAGSASQGWAKSTKALPIENVGCLVQVTSQQTNPDGSLSLAEAVTFVPDVEIRACLAPDGVTVLGPALFEIEEEDDDDDDDEDTGDDDDDEDTGDDDDDEDTGDDSED